MLRTAKDYIESVCSQSTTDPRLREAVLDAMAGGLAASDAVAAVTSGTADIAYRQLAVVDAAGGSAGFSGDLALGEATDVCAADAAAAGNLLADRGVPAAMLAILPNELATASATGSSPPWERAWPRGVRSPPLGRLEWSSPGRRRGRSRTCGSTGTTTR